MRPLVGLTPEQAQLAWERAVQIAGAGKVTAQLVKRAVRELQGAAPAKPAASKRGPSRAEKRRLIDTAFGELLLLPSQKAGHDLLTPKVEALHSQVSALLATPVRKPAANAPG